MCRLSWFYEDQSLLSAFLIRETRGLSPRSERRLRSKVILVPAGHSVSGLGHLAPRPGLRGPECRAQCRDAHRTRVASTRRYPVIPQAGYRLHPALVVCPRTLEILPEGRIACRQIAIWPRLQPIPVPQRRSAPRTPPLPIGSLGGLGSTSTWMTSRRTKSLKGTFVPPRPLPGSVFWAIGSTTSQYVRATGYAVHTNGVSSQRLLSSPVSTLRHAQAGQGRLPLHLHPIHPSPPTLHSQIQYYLPFLTLRSQVQYYPSFLTLHPEIYIPSSPPPPLQKDMNRDGRQAIRQSESRLRRTSSPLRWAGPTEEGRPS